MPKLDYDKLAVMQLTFAVTRCDTNKNVWDISSFARARKGYTKQYILNLVGTVLHQITEANDKLPPLGTAYDFNPGHRSITLAILGLTPLTALVDVPFFKHAKFQAMDHIPLFPYKIMLLKFRGTSHPFYGHGDMYHLLKSLVEVSLRSGIRYVDFAGFFVSLVSLVAGGSSYNMLKHFIIYYKILQCIALYHIVSQYTPIYSSCILMYFQTSSFLQSFKISRHCMVLEHPGTVLPDICIAPS